MRVVFIELAKYIFAFFIAFYVAASYYGASSQNENIYIPKHIDVSVSFVRIFAVISIK